ncbi:hypothetical protein BDV12DRAFT_11458 [Aspergillus spectabilis]
MKWRLPILYLTARIRGTSLLMGWLPAWPWADFLLARQNADRRLELAHRLVHATFLSKDFVAESRLPAVINMTISPMFQRGIRTIITGISCPEYRQMLCSGPGVYKLSLCVDPRVVRSIYISGSIYTYT